MRAMRVVLAVLVACLVVPGAAALAAPDPIDTSSALPDIEVKGTIAPTKAQRARARRLGDVAWNQFGTPSSLVASDGTLATVAGDSAVAAARAWLERNKALVQAELDGRPRARERLQARRHRRARRVTAPDRRRAARLGRRPRHDRRHEGRRRLADRLGDLDGQRRRDARRQAAAQGRARLAEGGEQRRPVALRSRRSTVRAAPSCACADGAASRSPALPTSSRPAPVAFPTVASGYVPAYETIVLDTSEARRRPTASFVDARSGKVLARESMVDHADDRQLKSQTFNYSGTLPATNGACDVKKGPYTVTAGSGVRAIDTTATADNPANDIVLNLYNGTTLVAPAGHRHVARAHPLRARRRRPARATTSSRSATSATATAPVGRATYTGTLLIDDSPPPAPYLARWSLFPANPPLNALDADPWNNPSTDTRQKWCWRSSTTAADCDRVIGNLASRTPWDVDGKTGAATNTTIGNNARTAESWTERRAARAEPVPPDERDARLHVPVDERVVYARLQPGRRRGRRPELRRLGGGDEPVHDAQPDARLVLPARLHRGELERAVEQLRPHRVASRRTTPSSATRRPARAAPPAATPTARTTRT